MIDYKKYKWFYTKSGKLVIGGKSAEQNDVLLTELKKMNKDLIVMHTKSPGSPFCAILAAVGTVSEKDIEECAVFTGCFSRAWKEGRESVVIDIFKLSQLSKNKIMKTGTWQVNGKIVNHPVNLELVLIKQEGIVRAVPVATADPENIIAYASPGKIDKVEAVATTKILALLKLNKEQLIAALPAGGVRFGKK